MLSLFSSLPRLCSTVHLHPLRPPHPHQHLLPHLHLYSTRTHKHTPDVTKPHAHRRMCVWTGCSGIRPCFTMHWHGSQIVRLSIRASRSCRFHPWSKNMCRIACASCVRRALFRPHRLHLQQQPCLLPSHPHHHSLFSHPRPHSMVHRPPPLRSSPHRLSTLCRLISPCPLLCPRPLHHHSLYLHSPPPRPLHHHRQSKRFKRSPPSCMCVRDCLNSSSN